MKRAALLVPVAVLVVAGCSVVQSFSIYSYAVTPPQELKQDFGTNAGMLPKVDCSADATVCSKLANLPSGATTACESNQCVAKFDVRVVQGVNLVKMAGFPPEVATAGSGALSLVEVDNVAYWTASNTVSFATPPIDVYVGDATTMSETASTAQKLGTIGSIPAGMSPSAAPDCSKGPASTVATACDLQLAPAGKTLLSTLARNFVNPFNIILVGHVTVRGGDALPSGKIDLFVQPTLGFHL